MTAAAPSLQPEYVVRGRNDNREKPRKNKVACPKYAPEAGKEV